MFVRVCGQARLLGFMQWTGLEFRICALWGLPVDVHFWCFGVCIRWFVCCLCKWGFGGIGCLSFGVDLDCGWDVLVILLFVLGVGCNVVF